MLASGRRTRAARPLIWQRASMQSQPTEPTNPSLPPPLNFLRRPVFVSAPSGTLTVWRWLGWQGLLLQLMLLGSLSNRFLLYLFHWPVHPAAMLRFLGHPSWEAAALVLTGPALEEVAFRAFLTTSPGFVFTGLTLFAAYVYLFIQGIVAPITFPASALSVLEHYLSAFWVLAPAGAVSLLLYRYRRQVLLDFFQHHAGVVFWTSCIMFGAAHSRLYTGTFAWWGFALVMPQFLAGIGLAYLRANFGLRWSVASHYGIDIPLVLLAWSYSSSALPAFLRWMSLALIAVLLAVMSYGLVVLWHLAKPERRKARVEV